MSSDEPIFKVRMFACDFEFGMAVNDIGSRRSNSNFGHHFVIQGFNWKFT